LNAYLFTNLAVVCILLYGLWNRKPVWDVSIRFPNLLLLLVILNTILIFREVIFFGTRQKSKAISARKKKAKREHKSLGELRSLLQTADPADDSLLGNTTARLKSISGCETTALYIIENNQCRLVSSAGEMPAALVGGRFSIRDGNLLIKYPGNLGEEEMGKLPGETSSIRFSSAITRLELTALPLTIKSGRTGLCIFADKEAHKALSIPPTSTALFLETLLALVESEKSDNDTRYRDKSTGLLKYSCFADSFETEIERSERYKQEMSLFSLTISGFRELGDAEKSQTGKNAAIALKQSLRRLDLMFCGQSEGEFLAILTETGVDSAILVARRIQKTFAKLTEKSDLDKKGSLKIVIGSATCPTDATHGQGLLEKSREAMSEAEKSADFFHTFSSGDSRTTDQHS
jgi:diguanylate cyclase (GGDEF)-like protein